MLDLENEGCINAAKIRHSAETRLVRASKNGYNKRPKGGKRRFCTLFETILYACDTRFQQKMLPLQAKRQTTRQ